MTKYVALLRGIAPTNPNMRNEKLRGVFEELGFKNVSSVISSGNILFETSRNNALAIETMIEEALQVNLGFKSTTIVRSKSELQALVDANPFSGRSHSQQMYLVVTFLKSVPQHRLVFPASYPIAKTYDRETCSVVDEDRKRSADPTIWLEKNYGKDITTRTWKTVLRIYEKLT